MRDRLLYISIGLLIGFAVGLVRFAEPAAAQEGQFVVTSEHVTYCAGEDFPGVPETGVIHGVYHFEITFEVPPDESEGAAYDANTFEYRIWQNPARDPSAFQVIIRSQWGNGFRMQHCSDGMSIIGFHNPNASGRDACIHWSNDRRTLSFEIPAFAMSHSWPGYGGPIYYEVRTYSYCCSLWQPHYGAWFVTGQSTNDPACAVPVAERTWGATKLMYNE